MRFTQHIVFYADSDEEVLELFSSGDDSEGSALIGGKVLHSRDQPGRYIIQVDFESLEAAQANNERPETQAWAERLRAIARSEIKWENLDVVAEM